jgi:hypothetical protein
MTSPQPDLKENASHRGRLKFILLGLFFALPVAAGWLVWWLDIGTGASANYGTLLPPRPVPAGPFAPFKGKWVLVQIDAAACDAACERKLYFMRQVRRATHRDMPRVERLWIVTDGKSPAPALLAAIEGTLIAPADNQLLAAFPAEGSPAAYIYLVDPLGNLMLRFPRDPDPSLMLKDLKRLLKASSFG